MAREGEELHSPAPAGPAAPVGSRADPEPDHDRRVQIDALRALAIFAVLWDHFMGAEGPVAFGVLGVRLFLIISGYLVTRIILRARTGAALRGGSRRTVLGAFFIRRALRIWPAHIAVLLLVYAFGQDQAREFIQWHAVFLTNILFSIRDEWGPPWMLAHLWTLSVQEQFYAVWPALLLVLPRRLILPAIGFGFAAAILFRIVMLALGQEGSVAFSALPVASFDALGLGALFAVLESRPGAARWLRPAPLLAVIVAAVLLAADDVFAPGRWVTHLALPTLWLLPLGALLAGAIHGYGGWGRALLGNSVLRYLGRISLGIYVYHLPVWMVMFAVAGLADQSHLLAAGPLAFAIGAPLTVAVAALSWHLLEKPINDLKSRFPYLARPPQDPVATPAQ